MQLSIVTINYNTPQLVRDCVASIKKNLKNFSYEIIIIDNASEAESIKVLKKLAKAHSNISLILNNANLGFAKANNQGIKAAKGEYVLLLNSDTILEKDIISGLIQWLKAHSKVGVVSAALKNIDGSLQRNGGFFPNLWTVFLWMFFVEDLPLVDKIVPTFHPKPSNKARQQDWVTGAFMLMPKSAINEVGMMPEDYFMYTEDVDYCYQFKSKGWQVWYLPQYSIVHLGGRSSKKGSGLVQEFVTMKIFWRRHFSAWQMPILRALLKAGAMMRMVLFGILDGKESRQIYAQAFSKV